MTESLLWYATRAAGIVSLIMLTGVVCLGVVSAVKWQRPGWPRFLSLELHRTVSLVTLVFLAIHIVIAVVDPYTALGWQAALIPFGSAYRTLWLGLGSVSLYLMAAIVVTSLLRARLGHRAWHAIHWLTYSLWPIALIHGFGTGTDSSATWMWAVDGACVVAVLTAVAWRLLSANQERATLEAAIPTASRVYR